MAKMQMLRGGSRRRSDVSGGEAGDGVGDRTGPWPTDCTACDFAESPTLTTTRMGAIGAS